ncbi:MAG TPA: hypothetical protein VFC84_18740 [Desulfosporosinus sp.]|nr:hypothetical protein [Desulfosporosinus sp.]
MLCSFIYFAFWKSSIRTHQITLEFKYGDHAGLLLESSFVLSHLQTPSAVYSLTTHPIKTTILQATFDQPKRMSFIIDKEIMILDMQSLQIQAEGAKEEQVTLNQTIILKGINSPNLLPEFEALTSMMDGIR